MDGERFWSKVDQCGACWLWTGPRGGDGCGVFNFKGRPYSAHRTAYALTHGEIPPGLVVMHSCDNRWRVNPAHLRVGTQAENVRDMHSKGRRRQKYKAHLNQKLYGAADRPKRLWNGKEY